LLAVGQTGTGSFINGDYLKQNLARFQMTAGFKIGPIDFVNSLKHSLGLKRRALQTVNDLIDKLLIQLLLCKTIPFLQ
jgi:hypothetical protein